MPPDPWKDARPCWHEMPNNYDIDSDYYGSLWCQLYPHEKGTSHLSLTPSGNLRQWRDHHGTAYPRGF